MARSIRRISDLLAARPLYAVRCGSETEFWCAEHVSTVHDRPPIMSSQCSQCLMLAAPLAAGLADVAEDAERFRAERRALRRGRRGAHLPVLDAYNARRLVNHPVRMWCDRRSFRLYVVSADAYDGTPWPLGMGTTEAAAWAEAREL